MNSIALATAVAISAVVAACSGSGPPPPSAATPTPTTTTTRAPATPTAAAPATPTDMATMAPATPSASPSGPPTVGRCVGDDLLWEQLPPPVQAYTFAWTNRDAADRLTGLQEGMADDASFVDPTMDEPVVGHEALSAHIGEFLAARPGHYFAMREWIPADDHHGHIRLRWMLCNSSGQPVLEGEEIAALDSNGRISAVVRFLDTP